MKRRRRLLLQSLAAALAPLPQVTTAALIESGRDVVTYTGTLRAFLDTLIPADETPAASTLGIDQALLEVARHRADYRRLIEQGSEWLDRSARALGATSFAAASEELRIEVVRQAEQAKARTLPRMLFERVRFDAMHLYYAQSAAWTALGYTGPPSPPAFSISSVPPLCGDESGAAP